MTPAAKSIGNHPIMMTKNVEIFPGARETVAAIVCIKPHLPGDVGKLPSAARFDVVAEENVWRAVVRIVIHKGNPALAGERHVVRKLDA